MLLNYNFVVRLPFLKKILISLCTSMIVCFFSMTFIVYLVYACHLSPLCDGVIYPYTNLTAPVVPSVVP